MFNGKTHYFSGHVQQLCNKLPEGSRLAVHSLDSAGSPAPGPTPTLAPATVQRFSVVTFQARASPSPRSVGSKKDTRQPLFAMADRMPLFGKKKPAKNQGLFSNHRFSKLWLDVGLSAFQMPIFVDICAMEPLGTVQRVAFLLMLRGLYFFSQHPAKSNWFLTILIKYTYTHVYIYIHIFFS